MELINELVMIVPKIFWDSWQRKSHKLNSCWICLLLWHATGHFISLIPCGRYPSLRVAYIDEVEKTSKDKSKRTEEKVYYSALAKAALPKSIDSSDPVQNLDQVKVLMSMLLLYMIKGIWPWFQWWEMLHLEGLCCPASTLIG